MRKKKNLITLPQGSNWVFWYPKVCIQSMFRWDGGFRHPTWIRAALLLSVIPFFFLTASLSWFWCLVIGVTAWYSGVLINKLGTALSRFPADIYLKAVLVALFWVCVGRFIWLNYLLIMNAFHWIGNWF